MRQPLRRVDRKFIKKSEEILRERRRKKLSSGRVTSVPKFCKLIMKCPSWKRVEMELRTLPEKPRKKKVNKT